MSELLPKTDFWNARVFSLLWEDDLLWTGREWYVNTENGYVKISVEKIVQFTGEKTVSVIFQLSHSRVWARKSSNPTALRRMIQLAGPLMMPKDAKVLPFRRTS